MSNREPATQAFASVSTSDSSVQQSAMIGRPGAAQAVGDAARQVGRAVSVVPGAVAVTIVKSGQ